MEPRYIVMRTTYQNGDMTRTCFGIAAVEVCDGVTVAMHSVSDLSQDEKEMEQLAERCNVLRLDPVHLYDIAEDYLMNA